jgi:hypothetical protein
MFGFLKKLFGGDPETNKEAGVQIEQVPRKVEPPVVEDKVKVVNDQPIVKQAAPAAITAAKKSTPKKEGAKKPAVKKEGAKKTTTGTRGRKPKAK